MSTRKAIGTSAHAAPIAWVYLRGGVTAAQGYTFRWRRGETVAYVLKGKQLDSHSIIGIFTTVQVPPDGWVDMGHVRAQGERWLTTHQARGADR